MTAIHNFRHPEFRERVTEAILGMLTQLPETQRSIFVWNHYRGYPAKEIAEILRCSPSEVEATLEAINSILYQRTRSLLEEDLQCDLSPEGRDCWGIGIYRELVEPERIVYTDAFAKAEGKPVPPACRDMSLGRPPGTLVTVTFAEHEGKTKLSLQHAGMPSSGDGDMAEAGAGESVDRLAEYS